MLPADYIAQENHKYESTLTVCLDNYTVLDSLQTGTLE